MKPNTNQQPLSLAFIGGSIKSAVGYAHFAAARLDNRWQLKAGCFSRNEEINSATARQWGIDSSRVYSDWKNLLTAEKDKIDAVVILLPTPDHAEVAMAAVNSGYAVICEKSLATSAAEGKRVSECVRQNSGFMAITYNYSGYPMIRELKQIIATKKLGKIKQVLVEMPQESYKRMTPDGKEPQPQPWRMQDYNIPTIALDLGVHVHHLVAFLTGERALEVMSDQSNQGEHVAVIDNIMSVAKYSNDMRCQMWLSKTAIGHRNGLYIRVFGETGSAEWLQENPEELRLNFVSGQRIVLDRASESLLVARQPRYNRFKAGHPAGFIEAFANLYSDIADNLILFKQGKPFDREYICNLQLAVDGLDFFETMQRASNDHCWQTLAGASTKGGNIHE